MDEEARFATTPLLAEMLLPNTDDKGYPGLDLVEAEGLAPAVDPTAKDLLAAMDEQEAVCANRVRERMEAQGLSQAELATKIGIGQPAVSMMLNRSCRPAAEDGAAVCPGVGGSTGGVVAASWVMRMAEGRWQTKQKEAVHFGLLESGNEPRLTP